MKLLNGRIKDGKEMLGGNVDVASNNRVWKNILDIN